MAWPRALLAAVLCERAQPLVPRRRSRAAATRRVVNVKAIGGDSFYGGKAGSPELLRSLSRPLLTKDEEQVLGNMVQRLVTIQRERQKWGPQPPADDVLALSLNYTDATAMRRDVAAGRAAREAMILSNMRLVVNAAKRAKRALPKDLAAGVDRDGQAAALSDLVAEGTLGLAKAVEKYEPQRGFRFSTYAIWWVRQAIQRAVRRRDIVPVPIHVQQLAKNADVASAALRDELGRQPTQDELRARLGAKATTGALARAELARTKTYSLDASLGRAQSKGSGAGEDARDTNVLIELLEAPEPAPLEAAAFHELRDALDGAMGRRLGPTERDVLRLRLGLDDGRLRTRPEVGAVLNKDKREVRSIERRALTKLRGPELGLIQYVEDAFGAPGFQP